MQTWGLQAWRALAKHTAGGDSFEVRTADIDVIPTLTFDTTHMPSVDSGVVDLTTVAGDSAPRILDTLIAYAYCARVSDIHIDPHEFMTVVRMRIDGELRALYSVPRAMHESLIARIKVLSGLRVDEHYRPHDGRFRTQTSTGGGLAQVDVRVSIAPTYYGENAVLRLLLSQSTLDIQRLGLSTQHHTQLVRGIRRPHGLTLVTGPTGSGKTTTLYTLLQLLDTQTQSVITLEDPIEYALPQVRQIQVNPATGFTFALGLRSIVRQDPDVVMVGEIRDTETAALAVQTALTGHLVLSTLHTNTALSAIVRLIDMGVDPYLIASTVTQVVGQRLVRTLCTGCKQPDSTYPLGSSVQTYRARGCGECMGQGTRGRTGVYEVYDIDEQLRTYIVDRTPLSHMSTYARDQGIPSLQDDVRIKVAAGLISYADAQTLLYE